MRNRRRNQLGWGGVLVLLAVLVWGVLTHPQEDLARMETADRGEYAAILWEGREYVPWGAADGRGKQIGFVDGDEEDKVYEYPGLDSERWIVNACSYDPGMLYREQGTVEIPEGVGESEYPWNPQQREGF